MSALNLTGALTAGPSSGGETFPGTSMQVPLAFAEGSKTLGAATGILTKTISSPAAYVALTGVGALNTVTQGSFLYFKGRGTFLLRLTTDDGVGGTVVSVVPVQGMLMVEFPTTRPLELLEVQGSGLIEYFVSGAS